VPLECDPVQHVHAGEGVEAVVDVGDLPDVGDAVMELLLQ
jgi:hypothetical protein